MSKQINLTKDPIWDLLRKVTIPASVGSLFQTFYNLVDTWFAGRISAEAIGAIAKSFPIYFVIIAVGVGIGAATNACIGNLLGEKKINKASLFIAQSVVFAIITSVIVTLFGLNVSNFLLGVMGSDAASIALTREYLDIIFYGTFIVMILLFIPIGIMVDVAEKIDKFKEKDVPLSSIFEYYIDFTWYFANLLFPIFLFLSVIWFTSKLANNTEVQTSRFCLLSKKN